MATKEKLHIKGRPQPSAPRAGYKGDGSRYEKGGKLKGGKKSS